jgi:ATP-dependent DNA helicase RecG
MPDLTLTALRTQVALGEDSSRQFKADVRNAESLASEMAAFANSEGGSLYLGVADDGTIPGLSRDDVGRINQLVSNAASQLVRSPLAVTTRNVALRDGRLVVVVTVPKGLDKPYFDKNGVIWLKTGSDKRRVNSKEELRRLFQMSDQFHADELPTKAGLDALDLLRLRDFLRDTYGQILPDAPAKRLKLLQNMNLATEDGHLNLAGLLLFGEQPQFFKPQFTLKAVRFPGSSIHESEYLDAEDFAGPLPQIYTNAHAFVMRNLPKIQAGRGVNTLGVSQVPPVVFEELLVNALIHRDYLVSAPIRLFVFDDRIEIVSPGNLPNNLTVEKIRAGNSNLRNPILASFVAKGMLPYRGLGSGIQRALEAWPNIEFRNDHDGCLFTSVVTGLSIPRPASGSGKSSVETPPSSGESSGETVSGSVETPDGSGKLLDVLRKHPERTIPELASEFGITTRAIEKQIAKLRTQGRLRRVGPTKNGRWEVL